MFARALLRLCIALGILAMIAVNIEVAIFIYWGGPWFLLAIPMALGFDVVAYRAAVRDWNI